MFPHTGRIDIGIEIMFSRGVAMSLALNVATAPFSRRDGDVIMLNLDDAIRSRHSTRMFLPQKPVPRALVDDALALAQCAPSNSNIQPWHIY